MAEQTVRERMAEALERIGNNLDGDTINKRNWGKQVNLCHDEIDAALGRHRAEPEELCPLCDKPSPGGEVHQECANHEQFLADAAAESERAEPTGGTA